MRILLIQHASLSEEPSQRVFTLVGDVDEFPLLIGVEPQVCRMRLHRQPPTRNQDADMLPVARQLVNGAISDLGGTALCGGIQRQFLEACLLFFQQRR